MTGARKIHEYEMTGAQKTDEYEMTDAQKTDEYEMTGVRKIHEYEMTDAQKKKIDAYGMTGAQKTREYEVIGAQKKTDVYKLMDSQKTREYEVIGAQKKTDVYKLMDSQKTREYEATGAQKKTHAYKLMDSQKTREHEVTGAQKTDEYEITGALNPCKQTKKVKNPCVQNSSCVEVRKNDGVEIVHNCQRKRACQDVDVKPVVRDPMDDDRVLVESGEKMTPVPHEPSEFKKQKHNLTHIPSPTMVHIMRQRQSTSGTTQANRAHHRRQRTPSDTM